MGFGSARTHTIRNRAIPTLPGNQRTANITQESIAAQVATFMKSIVLGEDSTCSTMKRTRKGMRMMMVGMGRGEKKMMPMNPMERTTAETRERKKKKVAGVRATIESWDMPNTNQQANELVSYDAVTLVISKFFAIDRVAGLLLLPYLGWITFATFLNCEICKRNPTDADGYNNAKFQAGLCRLQADAAAFADS